MAGVYMAAKRKLKPRPTYRRHEMEVINAAIKAAVQGSVVIQDYLSEVVQEAVDGPTEWDRAKREGRREFAGEWINIWMSEPTEG